METDLRVEFERELWDSFIDAARELPPETRTAELRKYVIAKLEGGNERT